MFRHSVNINKLKGKRNLKGDTDPSPTALQTFLTTQQPSSPISDLGKIAEIWMTTCPPASDRDELVRCLSGAERNWKLSWSKSSPSEVMSDLKSCMVRDSSGPVRAYDIDGINAKMRPGEKRYFGRYGEIRINSAFFGDFAPYEIIINVHGSLHRLVKSSQSEIHYMRHPD